MVELLAGGCVCACSVTVRGRALKEPAFLEHVAAAKGRMHPQAGGVV